MTKTTPQTALITGASGGIGLELARACAEHGHNLVLVARSHERLKMISHELQHTYNVQVDYMEQDLALPGAATEVAKRLAKDMVNIDILINNAGFGLGGNFADEDPVRIHGMMMVNMAALTELTRVFLPGMIKHKYGRILNVASTAAFLPGPFMAVYYATKAYVLSLSRGLAEELRDSGVSVTALCPGPTKTHFASGAGLENARLFRGNVMDAGTVARAGYSALMAGKGVEVPGLSNKIASYIPRIIPNRLVVRAARKFNGDN